MKISISLICMFYLFYAIPAHADVDIDPTLSYLDELLKSCRDQLEIWRSTYRLQVGFVILVSILGLVAAALQGLTAKYVKVATVALGVVISAITVTVNTLEMNSYRQISASIDKVEKIVRKMDAARLNYKMFKKPDNEIALEEFKKQYDRFLTIVDPPEIGPGKDPASRLVLLPVAYADDPLPGWLTQLPNSSKSLYFVGVADSARLPDAQAESIQSAKTAANQFLREAVEASGVNTSPAQSPGDTLTRSADEVDNHITYDERTGLYRYYSLVRVNRSQAQSDTRFLYLKNGIDNPVAALKSINDVQRQDNDYAAKRLRLKEQQIDQTSKTLTAEQYQKFSDARQARQTDAPQQAIPLLKDVVAQQPEFYLGWFNLALAYSRNDEDLPARQAYQRAITLEPLQLARDSTVYNSYGHFLLQRREYCESIKILEQAVSLEPQNTLAQRNLEKAKADMTKGAVICP
jgi:hypothetical protein